MKSILRQYEGYFSSPKLATAGLLAATAPVTIPLAMFAGPSIYRGMKRNAINNLRAKRDQFKNQYQNIKQNLVTTRNQLGNIKNNLKSNVMNKMMK